MSSLRFVAAALAAAVVLTSAVRQAAAVGETATALVKLQDGTDAGTVVFTEGTAGVLLKFSLKGLPPGAHAVHIHETGNCSGDFAGAGRLYNPLGAKHGFLHDEGPMAGDLPNIYAASDATVNAEILSPFLTLSTEAEESLFDADGAAIVISEKADNYESEPDGNSGARIACGVISINK